MWFNQVKTAALLAALSGLLMIIGSLLGGMSGLVLFFFISLAMNAFAYFYSDKLVLRSYNAQPLSREQYGWIYDIVAELAQKEGMPMPSMWIIETPMANAFATGRNPSHASVAVTTGILSVLEPHELRGVLAHELSHVKNRDILISSIAATIASTIGFLANMMQHMAFFSSLGGRSSDDRRGSNPLVLIVIAILMPIAASLIQLAISRSREYLADESGAELSHDPLALASALEKLEARAQKVHFADNDTARATTAHLFIVKPFSGHGLSALFSTHPPMAQRIARLRAMYEQMMHMR